MERHARPNKTNRAIKITVRSYEHPPQMTCVKNCQVGQSDISERWATFELISMTTCSLPEVFDLIIETVIDDWALPHSVYDCPHISARGSLSQSFIHAVTRRFSDAIEKEIDEHLQSSGADKSGFVRASFLSSNACILLSGPNGENLLKNLRILFPKLPEQVSDLYACNFHSKKRVSTSEDSAPKRAKPWELD